MEPIGIEESGLIGCGNRGDGRRGGEGGQVEATDGKIEASFAASTHVMIVGRYVYWNCVGR